VSAPWITAIAAPHLLRGVEAVGGDAAALAARFGLPGSPRFEDRIPLGLVVDAWEAAIEVTGRRDLPVLAATRVEHDERSLIGFVVANQRTLGDGVARLDRYFPAVSNAYRWRHLLEADGLHLAVSPPGPIHRAGWQAYLEFEALDMTAIGVRLAGEQARPTTVRFLHATPSAAAVAALTAGFGVAPVFAAAACELVYPAAVLELPVPTARPQLSALVEEQLTAMIDAIERGHDVSARARTAIAGLFRTGTCDVAGLARALHMSRRSLERALAAEGTSASAVIEGEREQLALAWLPELSVDEVAARLGYSDSRAFARAFKRWTGRAPSEVRRR